MTRPVPPAGVDPPTGAESPMTDHGHATKHPRLAELEGMVRDGRIDTIVVAFPTCRAGSWGSA